MKFMTSFRNTSRRVWPGRLLIVIFIVAAVSAGGTPRARADDAAQVVTTWPAREKLVALTFDAGSDVGVADDIMDILAEHGAKATFFLTGRWMEMSPAAAARIPREGHALGNHSYTHPDFTGLSVEQMRMEIRKTEELATEVVGHTLRPYFRPPYGAYDRDVLRAAAAEGYRYSVMWTIDTLDWKGIPADEILERVTEQLRPGAVVLMHVGSGTRTKEALPAILQHLSDRGYTSVTLDRLIASTEPATVYTVRAGDTLFAIAEQFAVPPEELEAENEGVDFSTLQAGQMLVIPGDPPKEREETEEPGGEAEESTEGPDDPEEEEATETAPAPGEEGAGREEIQPEPESPSLLDVLRQQAGWLWRQLAGLVQRLLDWIIS